MEVVHAASVASGLELFQNEQFDVVVLDHYFQTSTGMEFLAAIQSLPGRVPVLYVTGSNEAQIAIDALKAGAADFVIKNVGDDFFPLLRTAINQAWSGLQATKLDAQVLGSKYTQDTGKITYRYTWHLPKDRTWAYTGQLNMIRQDGRWQVRWGSTDLHPNLGEHQSFQLRADQPIRASVNELGGTNVLVPGYHYNYALNARSAAGELMRTSRVVADVLRQFDNTMDAQRLAEQASSSTGPLNLITLRREDNDKVSGALGHLPGVVITPQPEMVPTDPRFAPAIVTEVKKQVADQLVGQPGWRVVSVNQNGADIDVLNEVPGKPAPSITISLDRNVQNAAQDAVNMVGRKAMIVAIKPSTGEILAVAQNAAADADGPTATMGLYPPGSTFKMVTAGAAIESDMAGPNTLLGCPGTIDIGHRTIPNYDRFDLGVVPMSRAFANSCNTTFADISTKLAPGELKETGKKFGFGVDYEIPGLTTTTGSIPEGKEVLERTEAGYGQGYDHNFALDKGLTKTPGLAARRHAAMAAEK